MAGALAIDVGENPMLSRNAAAATAAYFDVSSGALYYIPKGRGDVWRLDAPDAARDQQYWRSKPFQLAAPVNFGVIRVDADIGLNSADAAADAAARDAVIAARAAALAAGAIGDTLDGFTIDTTELNGDMLDPLPTVSGFLEVGVYATIATDPAHPDDVTKVKVATITETNKPARLPSGFKSDIWEIDVTGDLSVSQIIVAGTMAELAQVQ